MSLCKSVSTGQVCGGNSEIVKEVVSLIIPLFKVDLEIAFPKCIVLLGVQMGDPGLSSRIPLFFPPSTKAFLNSILESVQSLGNFNTMRPKLHQISPKKAF